MECYCGSEKPFGMYCEPFLEGKALPTTPEELMRSRYSAYVVGNGAYIVATSVKENRYNKKHKKCCA